MLGRKRELKRKKSQREIFQLLVHPASPNEFNSQNLAEPKLEARNQEPTLGLQQWCRVPKTWVILLGFIRSPAKSTIRSGVTGTRTGALMGYQCSRQRIGLLWHGFHAVSLMALSSCFTHSYSHDHLVIPFLCLQFPLSVHINDLKSAFPVQICFLKNILPR